MRRLIFVTLGLFILASCSQEADTDNTTGGICPAKHPPYNPKSLKDCVSACIACENGTMVTCTTSCNLKGAK